jgi:hypothetical protein
MEIKATLTKPYTEEQRINFIIQNNHTLGYKIEYTENGLEAWGYTDAELIEQAKNDKRYEIDLKIDALEKASVNELLYGSEENIKVYKDIIQGLRETRDSI